MTSSKRHPTNEIEVFLGRSEAAEYIRERGLQITKGTLQKYATVGGGPLYRKFGKRVVYLPSDIDNWIEQRLSSPRTGA